MKNKDTAEYLRMIADMIEDGYVHSLTIETRHNMVDSYEGPIITGNKILTVTYTEGPKRKSKEPEKTAREFHTNDLSTALSMLGDVVSSAKDFEAIKRTTPIMIEWIKERYCIC